MENSTKQLGGRARGRGGPTNFLVKTYEMVDDPSTDAIVSWSQSNDSFIVKDSVEFTSNVLTKYFKHNNFSSFVRQLNAYGFHKINHDQWEFANEYFLKDQYCLLGNIHRKKTVHSHSHGKAERLSFEKEIEKPANEKAYIELHTSNFRQYMPTKELHVRNLVQRLEATQNRQNNLRESFEMVLKNSELIEKMNKKIEFLFSLKFPNKRPFIDATDINMDFEFRDFGDILAEIDCN